MYKSSGGQTSLFDDPTNFIGAKLSPENRWVKMAAMIDSMGLDRREIW